MKYRNLGSSGLKVSSLCLGTMQFGWTATAEQSHLVMDTYVEAGGNFIDTADVYSRWAEGNEGGVSEDIIGRWLRGRSDRDQLVIATKVRGTMGPGPNDVGLSRRHIMAAAEASLRRLQLDYIDLYQSHSDDLETPLDETLEAFDRLIRQGKIRYAGASNHAAWRLMKCLSISQSHGWAQYISLQPPYSLANRSFETELQPLCVGEGIGVIPYSSLAAGFLTGKYRRDQQLPASDRADGVSQRYFTDTGWDTVEAVARVATRHGTTMPQVSLAWLLQRASITAPIIGANSVEQLKESLGSDDLVLTAADILELDSASGG